MPRRMEADFVDAIAIAIKRGKGRCDLVGKHRVLTGLSSACLRAELAKRLDDLVGAKSGDRVDESFITCHDIVALKGRRLIESCAITA